MRNYWSDIRDAGWRFSDTLWCSFCASLTFCLLVTLIVWWQG